MDYKPEKPIYPAYVDDVFAFSPCDLSRGLLRPAKDGSGKQGLATLRQGVSEFKAAWKMDLNQKTQLKIRFLTDGKIYEQIIKMSSLHTFLGEKPYFQCKCGKRCGKLYLRNNCWLCRECHNLRYFLSFGLNKRCLCGELSYRLNRWCRIMDLKDKIKRGVYKDNLTHSAQRLLNAMHKWQFGAKPQGRLQNALAALKLKAA